MSHHVKSKCFSLIIIIVLFSTCAMGQNKFVGSQKCVSCHKQIYETWKESSHSKVVQELTATNDSVIVDWKGEIKVKSGKIPEATIKLSKGENGSYLATLVDTKDPSRQVTYKVVRTQGFGSIKGQQYYIKIGSNYYSLPIIWDPFSFIFKASSLDSWYKEDGSLTQPLIEKSWEMTCSGCHYTGMQLQKTATNGYEATYSEVGIACEKCHGPGSEHVESPEAKGKIINPRNLDYQIGMDVCNQCHSVGNGKSVPNGIFSFPWDEEKNKPYSIGETLTDYYRPVGMSSSQDAGKQIVINTYHSLSKSKHYEARTTCFDCHNPHGGPAKAQLARSDVNNDLCLYCHGKEKEFASPSLIMQHTKQSYTPVLNGASRCLACHNIGTRRQAIPSDTPRPRSNAGFLGVIKSQLNQETQKSNPAIPAGKTAAEAAIGT
jgi:predicted CXXCH cytochrome family protein